MELSLTEEEERFAERARTWLMDNLAGRFAHLAGKGGSQNDEFHDDRRAWEKALFEAGWQGLGWPEEFGGSPATLNERIVFEYEYAKAGAPHRVGVHGMTLIGPTLLAHGTEKQRARFLPPILSCEEEWCQGFSEPGAGSDLASLRTRATLVDDEWVINGQKIWTSGAHHADWMYILCRTDPDASKHRGITMLLLPMDQPGIEIRPIKNMAGGSHFNEVFFTDARTSKDMVVGALNDGWNVAMTTLQSERGVATLNYQMAFQSEFDNIVELARQNAKDRDPLLRQKLADTAIGLQVMQLNTFRMLSQLMRTGTLGAETSLLKLYWPDLHKSMGELAMEIAGPAAQLVGEDYNLSQFQRSWLLSRAESIYGGSHQIHLNIISERLLGMPREPKVATTAGRS
ncbi:acyl-CoA dehydrogenase family protein [Nocardioides sp. WS12]|uniref:acyl-CoA dehydrogenase family protein n=1 Tax=Nocardioides sp. WS12 TaxID=2486272 RepID=UPI0015FB5159|nr:acyl-CoA dehydrogenase family protein [Nocardioides sp. WS12]